MSDFQPFQTQGIIPNQTEAIVPLENIKAFFYLYNAKPDTEIHFLSGGKIIDKSDIQRIEEEVAAKLGNHTTLGSTVSISLMLSNKRAKDFSTWAEFEKIKWETINERVESININWNILIQLPQYKSPQTHSMKLRVGKSIPPKDMFQLLLTSDNASEVMEAGAPGICKVDFINITIANELLFIVDEWYKGLKKFPEPNVVEKFIKNHGKNTTQVIRFFFPLLLLFIYCLYTQYFHSILGITKEISIEGLQKSLLLLLTVFMLGSFLGSKIEKSIDKRINKLEEYPAFLLTKGDANAVDNFEQKNKTLVNQIYSRVFWILFSIPISSFGKLLLDYFNPLKVTN